VLKLGLEHHLIVQRTVCKELGFDTGGVGLLGQLGVVFEGLSFGQEGDCLGNLRVPFGTDFEAFELTELRGEELALNALLDPAIDCGDVRIGVFDRVVFQEGLELLHNCIINHEVFCDSVGGEVVLTEVEEGVVAEKIVLEVIGLQVVDLLVGGDAAAAVDGATRVGELHLEVALVLGFVGVIANVVVVVERDVIIVALNEAAGRCVVVIGGESETGVFGDLEDGLDQALAECGFADDECAVVILQCAGDDLSRRSSVAIDQDDDGELWSVFAARGAIDLVGEGAAALRDDDLTLLQELVGHIDGFVQEAAGVAAEVKHETVDVTELVERVADFVAGGFDEARDVNVADAGAKQEGEVNRGTGNFVADEIEDQGTG